MGDGRQDWYGECGLIANLRAQLERQRTALASERAGKERAQTELANARTYVDLVLDREGELRKKAAQDDERWLQDQSAIKVLRVANIKLEDRVVRLKEEIANTPDWKSVAEEYSRQLKQAKMALEAANKDLRTTTATLDRVCLENGNMKLERARCHSPTCGCVDVPASMVPNEPGWWKRAGDSSPVKVRKLQRPPYILVWQAEGMVYALSVENDGLWRGKDGIKT